MRVKMCLDVNLRYFINTCCFTIQLQQITFVLNDGFMNIK